LELIPYLKEQFIVQHNPAFGGILKMAITHFVREPFWEKEKCVHSRK
jgi:hypothetical protein